VAVAVDTGADPSTGLVPVGWRVICGEIEDDAIHLVMRGPHGGTVRVLRSPAGRADGELDERLPGWLTRRSKGSWPVCGQKRT
jgi:hypothetical protein